MVVKYNELDKLIDLLKSASKKIVLTNGAFDLVHKGHVTYLNKAKEYGDILIVGINSDASIKEYKSPLRPIIDEENRQMLIDNLKAVDFTVIFNDKTATNLIEKVKPDIYIKGGDYTLDNLPEKNILEKLNTETVFVKMVANSSTTNIVNKIIKIYGGTK